MIEFHSDDVRSAIASLPRAIHGVEITDTSTPAILQSLQHHRRSLFPAEYLYQGRTKLSRICNVCRESSRGDHPCRRNSTVIALVIETISKASRYRIS